MAALLGVLLFAAPSYGSLATPTLTGPANGVTTDAPPVFTWSAVAAGVTTTTLKTGTSGKVTFTFKPTKKGTITLAATKTNCQGVKATLSVL